MKKKRSKKIVKRKTISKKRIDLDAILNNSFLVLLITTSIISLILIGDYIGYATYHNARAGTISELDIREENPATYWYGMAGLILRFPGFSAQPTVTAKSSDVELKNFFFDCLQPGVTHELYVSTATPGTINWASVTAGTAAEVDAYLGTTGENNMSAQQTFHYTMSISLGGTTISDIPVVYTYKYNDTDSVDYPVGILTDGTNLIYVTKEINGFDEGYAPISILGLVNYQIMIPVASGTEEYYIYTDPYDECPEGEDEALGAGRVSGIVRDNQTGLPIDVAVVFVGISNDYSDSIGFYNVTEVPAGTYKLVATKEGYINYIANVTVISGNETFHDIYMEPFVDIQELTGTGSGVGTGEDDPGDKTKSKTGEGPGIGPGIGPFLEEPREPGVDHWVSLEKLYKKIRLGNFFQDSIMIYSFREIPAKVTVSISGNVSEIAELNRDSITVDPSSFENFTIRVLGSELGTYTGSIDIGGDFNDSIPVRIIVTDEDKLPIEALLMQLELLTLRPYASDEFKFRLNLQNMLTEEQYNVSLDYNIIGVEPITSNYSMYIGNDSIELLTASSQIKSFDIPKDWPKGDYAVIVDAEYLDLTSQVITHFKVYEPLYMYSVFGLIELWKLLLILFILSLLLLIGLIIKKRIEANKRFHVKIEYKLLPKKGPRSLYVGQIAETTNDTYFDMDLLTVHSIVAGSTGGGKSISAQVIIEECLLKDVGVVVFDPTAQWSGMLRKLEDAKMLQFYPRYHLTKKSARAFNGNVKSIDNPREKIKIFDYMKPGEIQVFTVNKLKPAEFDTFVANTVRTIFNSNLQEYRGLRFMLVYDEIHRILPKFGGSGEGFVQIERACREFRKWGVGVMLVSQVLSDFMGQIKANINTEVQMKTRDEGDLNRIKDRYGASFVQELVKSPVGSGLVQNSAWNRGHPYYVTFRPILHSVKRLSDEELNNYNKYNAIVEDLQYQLNQLEQEGQDVFDLNLELKLSLDKIKSGSFNMVEIYLEGLKPRIQKIWDAIGKTPLKKEIELVSEEELQADLDKAKSEREEFEKNNPEKKEDDGKEEKKGLGYTDDVKPEQILNLVNGMLCLTLASLYDEVAAMKEEDFAQHVNEEKSDFADWIRTAIENEEWAKIADTIIEKDDFVKFLDAIKNDKVKDFKPAKIIDRSAPKKEEKKKEKKDETSKTEGKKEVTQEKTTPEKTTESPKNENIKKVEQEKQVPKTPVKEETKVEKKPVEPIKSTEKPAKPIVQKEKEKETTNEKKESEEEETIDEYSHDIFIRKSTPGNEFVLDDGKKLKSIDSLYHWLNIATTDEFEKYVTPQRNDFSLWISGSLDFREIAFNIARLKNKKEIIDYLDALRKENNG